MFVSDRPSLDVAPAFDTGTLGAWYNNWGDLWGDLKAIGGAITGGGSGVNTGPITPPLAAFATDIQIVRTWADNVIWAGSVPTRMPAGRVGEGTLAVRIGGPGTSNPTGAVFYTQAPAHVLAADARIAAGYASDQTGALLEAMKSLGLAPGIPGNNADNAAMWEDLKKYALWGAIGVAALVVIPPLLNANAARRR